jgi:hypothetical protein
MSKKSTRRERFENVAARRTQRILEFLDSLSNCANKSNYEYSESDVKKMFKAIREATNRSEAAFDKHVSKEGNNTFRF